MKNELVLTFETALLDKVGRFQGLNSNYQPYIDAILTHEQCKFRSRRQVENDFNYKQIIPYIIIRSQGKLLHYVRGKKSGEQRLALNGSIGIGGHISIDDDDLFINYDNKIPTIYNNAVEREVFEEIDISISHTDNIIGVLNDDSNDVGKVHFGIVHIWDIDKPLVKKKESKITKLSFLDSNELTRKLDNLESWSKICLKNLL